MNSRQRPVFIAAIILVLIWAVAFTGYEIAKHARVTPEKVHEYVGSVDFAHLTGKARADAIARLAGMLNALSLDERRELGPDRLAWFKEMTEEEKSQFLEATLPTGFKQMLSAFEEMPKDKRKQVVDRTLKQMKKNKEKMAAGEKPQNGTNTVELSPELQDKVTKIGLQSFYSESSAESKAELAPLLEEMQRTMESGSMLRAPR